MPINNNVAADTWIRYQYIRDNGHLDYVAKAYQCENFFFGNQWTAEDLALLRAQRRPALTINKILNTISNVLGEQIFNRSEISFKPRNSGATQQMSDVLTKVFMQISDNNQLPWLRSDVFMDGLISSRGYYDLRMDFSDSLRGEVRIAQLNPKNVLVDPDADEYDPDSWGDVITTKWLSPNSIALLYNEEDAEQLRGRQESFFPYGYDSLDRDRDRFGFPRSVTYGIGPESTRETVRNIRIIERQHKKLDKMQHFVDIETGVLRIVPSNWDRNQIALYLQNNPDTAITKKMVQRIRWTVVADNFSLHDDWSPYKHFTVVPYFPYFRRGRTCGLVENLLGPQELLNKVSSQELHVVNTTANSGWKLKRNALQNMTVSELEQRGATTGLVLELDEIDNAEKITPNATPQGLDRISYKAEEHIKTISGTSDYDQGFAREDVSAKAVKANQSASSANHAKVLDNLTRTDHILARNILDYIQEFMSEERVLQITTDRLTGETEALEVNQVTPEGQILNDLTLGEFGVVVSSMPERDNFEDTQFEQLVNMRTKIGINVPDRYVIGASRLVNKAEIVKTMEGDAESPEGQRQAALKQRAEEAAVQVQEADASGKRAAATLAVAKAKGEIEGGGVDNSAELEHARKVEEMEREFELKRAQVEQEIELEKLKVMAQIKLAEMKAKADIEIKSKAASDKAMTDRVAAVHNTPVAPKVAPKPAAPPAPAPKEKRKMKHTKAEDGSILSEEID
jgi:hypothetical protein